MTEKYPSELPVCYFIVLLVVAFYSFVFDLPEQASGTHGFSRVAAAVFVPLPLLRRKIIKITPPPQPTTVPKF